MFEQNSVQQPLSMYLKMFLLSCAIKQVVSDLEDISKGSMYYAVLRFT